MGQRHILHCDCNCFYASVEMQEHPELRGKSIAVCGDPEARHGIVLTASYPAKRMGVKTGMPIWEAKQHCRDLIIVPASYGKCQKYSSYVREVFNDYTDQVESFGLDEAWLDITGSVGLFGSPVKIAKEISVRIKRELGITVSIGVSFNKITAKLGSDYKKPDAVTIIEPENYKEIVYPLPAGDLLYVGAATQRKLGSYGIRTIGQLAETNPETLKGWFGVMGYTLSALAWGLDQTLVAKQNAHTAIKSVGNSATTPRDLTTDEDVWLMLVLLSESVAMRMRDLGSKCNVVEIYVRDNELSGFTRRRKLDNPTNVSIEIARIAFDLFNADFGAAINDIVSAHPECSETTMEYDYEDGHTWASYWPEVLAVFAVQNNLNNDGDVVVIDEAKKQMIQDTFWSMIKITCEVEEVTATPEPTEDEPDQEPFTEYILHITVSSKSVDALADLYRFTQDQRDILHQLLSEEMRPSLLVLCGEIAVADGALCWPLPGHTYISCHFGEVDAFGNAGHRGTDIPAPEGTPILAAHSGTILVSGWNDSYGNQVLLDNGAGLSTRYAHMMQTAVTAGEAVTAGQVIGYVGSTGDSTGNHLHFEVMQNGVRMNPLELVFAQ